MKILTNLLNRIGGIGSATFIALHLSWEDNADNENGVSIERSTNGIDYTEIDTVTANTTSYDDNVSPGNTYYYRVRAYNNDGNSDYSNVASISV